MEQWTLPPTPRFLWGPEHPLQSRADDKVRAPPGSAHQGLAFWMSPVEAAAPAGAPPQPPTRTTCRPGWRPSAPLQQRQPGLTSASVPTWASGPVGPSLATCPSPITWSRPHLPLSLKPPELRPVPESTVLSPKPGALPIYIFPL